LIYEVSVGVDFGQMFGSVIIYRLIRQLTAIDLPLHPSFATVIKPTAIKQEFSHILQKYF
jgi:hypothetical protein